MRHEVLYSKFQWAHIPYLINTEPTLGQAAENMLIKGIRSFVDAARGAASATAGQQPQVLLAKAALQADLAAYSAAIGTFASELEMKPEYEFPTTPLTLAAYEQFILDAGTQGAAVVAPIESVMVQMLLNLSRVSWVDGDIASDIAAWIAEGADPQEIAGFQAQGGQLTTAQLFAGSRSWYWDRIDLNESPLVNP